MAPTPHQCAGELHAAGGRGDKGGCFAVPGTMGGSTNCGGVPCAVRALCTRCAKSWMFSTTGSSVSSED